VNNTFVPLLGVQLADRNALLAACKNAIQVLKDAGAKGPAFKTAKQLVRSYLHCFRSVSRNVENVEIHAMGWRRRRLL
jgi:hypothetical protein